MALFYCILAAFLLSMEEIRKYCAKKVNLEEEGGNHTELNEVS